MIPITLIDVAELTPRGPPFVPLHAVDGRPIVWHAHSGLPANLVERMVTRPRLSRYRAAWMAARDARRADAVISHLPRMSAAVERFAGSRRAPHLAFSFNFTTLPVGEDRARLAAALAPIEQVCVYSRFEVGLYADALGLDPGRIRPVLWTQSPPPVAAITDVPREPYVAAVGGEGRDFTALLAAARMTPAITYLVIARPSATLADPPRNVQVRTNLALADTWGLAARAAAVLVPLAGPETCCGHVTLVSARLLGLPLITTRSAATVDYVGGAGVTVLPPNDPTALAEAVCEAIEHGADRRAAAVAMLPALRARHHRAVWADYVADFVSRTITGGI